MRTSGIKYVSMMLCLVLAVSTTQSQTRAGKLGVGASGAYFLFQSDYPTRDLSFGGSVDLSYSLMEYLSLRTSMGAALLRAKNPPAPTLMTTLIHGDVALGVDLMPKSTYNPFIFVGGRGYHFDPRTGSRQALASPEGASGIGATVIGGIGIDIFLSEFSSITISGETSLPMSDRLDGLVSGSKKDGYHQLKIGLRHYFFDKGFVKRMIEAFDERTPE